MQYNIIQSKRGALPLGGPCESAHLRAAGICTRAPLLTADDFVESKSPHTQDQKEQNSKKKIGKNPPAKNNLLRKPKVLIFHSLAVCYQQVYQPGITKKLKGKAEEEEEEEED
jgi:hypothetical protein